MTITVFEEQLSTEHSVRVLRSTLLMIGEQFETSANLMCTAELGGSLAALEELAHTVEYLQVIGAAAAERQDIARVGETTHTLGWATPGSPSDGGGGGGGVPEFKDTADYLRARLRITRTEARRRLRTGAAVLPRFTLTGETLPALYEHTGTAFTTGTISLYATTQISDALTRVRTSADPAAVTAMEENLTAQAMESDADLLTVITRRWESALDPDGAGPTEETLTAHQGVFHRGRRQGLQRLEIAADDEQFEYLLTVMNTATNPRPTPTHTPANTPDTPDTLGNGADDGGNGVDGASADGPGSAGLGAGAGADGAGADGPAPDGPGGTGPDCAGQMHRYFRITRPLAPAGKGRRRVRAPSAPSRRFGRRPRGSGRRRSADARIPGSAPK